jgi:hypothetical protein
VIGALVAPTASAGTISSARARASALESDALAQARLVHRLTVHYQQDAAQASILRGDVSHLQRSVLGLRRQLNRTKAMLRQEALFSYVGGVPAPLVGDVANSVEQSDQAAYLSVAVGDISDTLDRYGIEQSELASSLSSLRQALGNALAAGRGAARARKRALTRAGSLQAMLAKARQQVAALVLAQRANAGPPVGNGIVRAVSVQMGAAGTPPANPATTTTSRPPTATGSPHPATAPNTVPPTAPTTSAHPPPAGGVWLELRECESGDNYQTDTGNGFYGAYQFAEQTWTGLGLPGYPNQAPYWVQDAAAQRLEAEDGWSPWPACSAALGL